MDILTRLYVDSYSDLLLFNITDVNNIEMTGRVESVLNSMTNMGFMVSSDRGVITDWVETKHEGNYVSECSGGPSVSRFDDGFFATPDVNFRAMANSENFSMPRGSTGVGGSMARFTIKGNHLYTVNENDLNVIDISKPDQPKYGITIYLGWGIETIFPYNNSLFIGAQNGMHIYDITNPSEPSFLSTFQHVNSCDPVVVEDDFAYVTLRSGNECDGHTNQLDVLDVSDLANPQLLKSYPMQNPHGLGTHLETLFICEGEYGLKIFDTKDKMQIGENMIEHFKDLHAYDVIPMGKTLILI